MLPPLREQRGGKDKCEGQEESSAASLERAERGARISVRVKRRAVREELLSANAAL